MYPKATATDRTVYAVGDAKFDRSFKTIRSVGRVSDLGIPVGKPIVPSTEHKRFEVVDADYIVPNYTRLKATKEKPSFRRHMVAGAVPSHASNRGRPHPCFRATSPVPHPPRTAGNRRQ